MRHALGTMSLLLLGTASTCPPQAPPPDGGSAAPVASVSSPLDALPALPAPVTPEAVRLADALAERAESCFADLHCSAAAAAQLYLAADDGGASRVSCFRFYY